jgi:hypothetical protein
MSLRDDYNERKGDVRAYVTLIKRIDAPRIGARRLPQKSRCIFRANVFIILYNLIESTVANCGKELDDEFVSMTTTQIHNMTEPIVNYWLKFTLFGCLTPKGKVRFKDNVNSGNVNIETLTKKLLDPQSLLELKFDFGRGGGNLDNVKIKEIFMKYGIEADMPEKLHQEVCQYRLNSGKGILQFIKDTRNALAHGEKSFTEFGDYSSQEIENFTKIVFEYLEFLIGIIEDFITNKKYLKGAITRKITRSRSLKGGR